MTQAVRKRYMAEVDKALIRQLKTRKQILDQIGRMVDQFGEENPEATYDDLLTAFGPAETLVEGLLADLPKEEVVQAKKKSLLRHRLGAALVVLVLAVTALFFFWQWQKAQEVIKGDFKVVIDPVEILTDEEMDALLKSTPSDAQSYIGE